LVGKKKQLLSRTFPIPLRKMTAPEDEDEIREAFRPAFGKDYEVCTDARLRHVRGC
jgi:hypothetical protein